MSAAARSGRRIWRRPGRSGPSVSCRAISSAIAPRRSAAAQFVRRRGGGVARHHRFDLLAKRLRRGGKNSFGAARRRTEMIALPPVDQGRQAALPGRQRLARGAEASQHVEILMTAELPAEPLRGRDPLADELWIQRLDQFELKTMHDDALTEFVDLLRSGHGPLSRPIAPGPAIGRYDAVDDRSVRRVQRPGSQRGIGRRDPRQQVVLGLRRQLHPLRGLAARRQPVGDRLDGALRQSVAVLLLGQVRDGIERGLRVARPSEVARQIARVVSQLTRGFVERRRYQAKQRTKPLHRAAEVMDTNRVRLGWPLERTARLGESIQDQEPGGISGRRRWTGPGLCDHGVTPPVSAATSTWK